MPAPLSIDLRQRILAAYKAGLGGFKELGKLFSVGEASVNRLVQLDKATGSVAPKPHGGGPAPRIPTGRLGEFKAIVDEHADATLVELADLCSEHFGIHISRWDVERACKRANITRKKRRSTMRSKTPKRSSKRRTGS